MIFKNRMPGNRGILSLFDRRWRMKLGAEIQHKVEDALYIVIINTCRRSKESTTLPQNGPYVAQVAAQ